MHCSYACNSPEHLLSRRRFLGGLAAGAAGSVIGGFSGLVQPAAAKELHKSQKRVLLVWLSGGSSQLETWDPKPGTDTGGPFQAMPTSVPGVHICELLPYTAQQMHRMVLVRGVNTFEAVRGDHGRGTYNMLTGIGNIVIAAGLVAALWQSRGAWRLVYANLLGATLTYSLTSISVNILTNTDSYSTGSLWDLGLVASFLWYAIAGAIAYQNRAKLEAPA